ncbi:MAG: hypothetical protein IJS14_05425 [Lentisphaeria bacterium]|nr:hypothetical protein [Lentisphaeria bacterium]
MEFSDFCRRMGFEADLIRQLDACRAELWDNSSEEFPFFMEESFYTHYYPLCRGPEPETVYPLMAEVASAVRSDPAAARYASMIRYALFLAPKPLKITWVEPRERFGRNTGIYHLMIALSALPLVEARYARLGLPEKYAADLAQWIGGTIGIHLAGTGVPGHFLQQTYWLRHAIEGRLFRIGRLEFLPLPWGEDMAAVYRHRSDRSLTVLCRDGWAFDEEGFRVDPASVKPAFTTKLTFFGGQVSGTPVDPFGKPIRGAVRTLDLSEWEPLCAPWEKAVTIHIPGGGGLTPDAVRDSLAEAVRFYHTYLHWDVKVFTCASWIVNPAWERELPDSNLAAFQRNGYMTPCPVPSGKPGMFFVYGRSHADPRELPCTTRLHQAFRRIFERGEPLRTGVLFIPADEVEMFGTEHYRKTRS